MIKYQEKLGGDKKLNEIVIAGSHDAAITSGPDNAKTQYRSIMHQAQSGSRFFDIRIAAQSSGGETTLTAFHAPGVSKKTKTRTVTGLGQRKVQVNKLKWEVFGSAWGLGLTSILDDALAFVKGEGDGEFIILKFDKCTNWPLIAETCRKVLGKRLYNIDGTDGNNINEMTLAQLGGKVICAFMSPGYRLLPRMERDGITEIKNLYKPPAAYVKKPTHPTLQYWGAGGTKTNNKDFEGKIKENIDTQKKILKKGATGVPDEYEEHYSTRLKRPYRRLKTPGCGHADPNVLGMMYWTTTGLFKNIRARNRLMWDENHNSGLNQIWKSGLQDYIDIALPESVDRLSYSSGGLLKLFMPNIVMIDFASAWRCEHIYDLNETAATELVKISQKYPGPGA
jgi:hypothetical protein